MQQKTVPLKTRAMQLIERQIEEDLEVFLRRRYLVEGASTVQIAAELGVNSGTVSRWMAHFDVEARLMGPRKAAI
jgi:transposase-like protein